MLMTVLIITYDSTLDIANEFNFVIFKVLNVSNPLIKSTKN